MGRLDQIAPSLICASTRDGQRSVATAASSKQSWSIIFHSALCRVTGTRLSLRGCQLWIGVQKGL